MKNINVKNSTKGDSSKKKNLSNKDISKKNNTDIKIGKEKKVIKDDKQKRIAKSNLNKKQKNLSNKNKFIERIKNVFSRKNKKDNKKVRSKRAINGKISLDIFDILIIVAATAFISCISTGFILNHQFRKNINYIDTNLIADDGVQNFLNIYSEIVDNFYEEVDEDKLLEAALDGMLDFLEDNYSIFLNKNDSNSLSESLEGSYEGIGIVAVANVIYDVYKDSPAEKAGLKINDEIISINGTDITVDNYELITELMSKDEENVIVVKREKETLTFNISTSKVNIPTVSWNVVKSSDKEKKIGYMQLASFSSHSYEEVQEALIDLEGKEKIDSLIIDLRGNTGGYLNVASDISSLFLAKGEVIYSLENKDEVTTYKDETKEKREYEIVVLVNASTASAAEILASALHDSYGASIVGKTTFGKGKVQTMKYYEDSIVKYTSAKWLRPNGECVDEKGIVPDYDVDLEYGENVIYDIQLDKAIELLS